MRRNRPITLLATGLAVALLAAGCGGGDDDDGGAATATTVASSTETTLAAASNPASGEPISIVFINNEGGSFSVPELRIGSEVAERATSTTSSGA